MKCMLPFAKRAATVCMFAVLAIALPGCEQNADSYTTNSLLPESNHTITNTTENQPNAENEFEQSAEPEKENDEEASVPETISEDSGAVPENALLSEYRYDDLHAAFVNAATGAEIGFYYDDFDGDGTFEAFGIIGDGEDGLYINVEIFYIAPDCTVSPVGTESFFYGCPLGLLSVDNVKFLQWSATAGGSGATAYLFGVKDGRTYEPEVSGCHDGFYYDENTGFYTGITPDYGSGIRENIASRYEYDSDIGEFVLADGQAVSTEPTPTLADVHLAQDGISWSLDDQGMLTLTGNGAMEDHMPAGAGWGSWVAKNVEVDTQYSYSIDSIKSIKISAGITDIGDSAFAYCANVTTVEIEDGVRTIGGWAFMENSKLSSITIPASVTSIDKLAFLNCTGLTDV